jgi:hypothetical protein
MIHYLPGTVQPSWLITMAQDQPRAADDAALLARPRQAGVDRSEMRMRSCLAMVARIEHRIFEDPAGVQVLLRKRP